MLHVQYDGDIGMNKSCKSILILFLADILLDDLE